MATETEVGRRWPANRFAPNHLAASFHDIHNPTTSNSRAKTQQIKKVSVETGDWYMLPVAAIGVSLQSARNRSRDMSNWLVTVLVILIGAVFLAPILIGAIFKEFKQSRVKQ